MDLPFFSSDYFEETKNMREFDHTNLWGNIGGFIGMILGMSLLQIPFSLANMYHFLRNKWSKIPPSNQGNARMAFNEGFKARKTIESYEY